MNWWKRLLTSLASALIAEILVIGVMASLNPRGARLDGFIVMSAFALCFILPGWLLAIPALLLLDPPEGWRFWVLASIGCLIGPLLMVAMQIWSLHTTPNQIPRGPGAFEYIAFAISIAATILYLGLSKLSARSRIEQTT